MRVVFEKEDINKLRKKGIYFATNIKPFFNKKTGQLTLEPRNVYEYIQETDRYGYNYNNSRNSDLYDLKEVMERGDVICVNINSSEEKKHNNGFKSQFETYTYDEIITKYKREKELDKILK